LVLRSSTEVVVHRWCVGVAAEVVCRGADMEVLSC